MKANLLFESAVYLSWITGMLIIIAGKYCLQTKWITSDTNTITKPFKELLYALLVCILIILFSIALFSIPNPTFLNKKLFFTCKLCIIYSPIFFYLRLSRQSIKTCYINGNLLEYKVIVGLVAAFTAVFVFLSINHNFQYQAFFAYLFSTISIQLLQTFLESVAIGFLFYRLIALLNKHFAALVVAAIFMCAHFQNYTSGMGFSYQEAILLILAHAGITYIILLFIASSKDVISIFFIHWFINTATEYLQINH